PWRGHDLLLPDPVDPGRTGELPDPADDRGARPGLPDPEPDELVYLHDWRNDRPRDPDLRWDRHGLGVLYAVLDDGLQDDGRARRDGGLHHGLLLDPDRAELHRDYPHDAGAGDDVVSLAALRLVALCDEPDHGPRDAGAGHRGGARGRG